MLYTKESAMQTREVDAIEGLQYLVKTIKKLESQEQLLLLRLLPAELSTSIFSDSQAIKNNTQSVINEYLQVVEKTIKGGDVGVSFWDKTIYGRLSGGRRARHLNHKTWEFISRVFFSEPLPDTTTLGISPEIVDWLLVVCTSRNMDENPTEYICSLRLASDSSTKLRPGRGVFTTDKRMVYKDAHMILEFERSLARQNQSWQIIGLTPPEIQQIKQEISRFMRDLY